MILDLEGEGFSAEQNLEKTTIGLYEEHDGLRKRKRRSRHGDDGRDDVSAQLKLTRACIDCLPLLRSIRC